VIDRCLARMLGRPGTNPVLGKLRNLAVAFAVATLVLLMVLLATAGTGLVERLDVNSTLVRVTGPLIALAVIVMICALLFRALARELSGWREALAGAALSGVVLQVTPTLAGYYMRWVADNTPVKAFLVLAGVLVCCYVVAAGMLLGAGVAARLQLGHRLGPAAVVSR
jgi:uncharacterized BrkB/YihY/UPF0761 family membrane protein